jgi:integrase/recombinase XerD
MTEPRQVMGKEEGMVKRLVLSVTEVLSILALIRAPMCKIALSLIYCCHLRVDEVATLRVEDVNRNSNILLIRGRKGHTPRQITLSEQALKVLDDLQPPPQPSVWLFPSKESHISVKTLHAAFQGALFQSGIQKKVFVISLLHSSVAHAMEKHREGNIMALSGQTNSSMTAYIQFAMLEMQTPFAPPEKV